MQVFFQKLNEQIKHIMNNNIIKESDIGHMVPMKCGHRGRPNKSEEKLLDHLLRDSNFINQKSHLDEDPHFHLRASDEYISSLLKGTASVKVRQIDRKDLSEDEDDLKDIVLEIEEEDLE